eukprot:scaffold1678_cov80-Cylindrotheca_fusiformis.AAC.7
MSSVGNIEGMDLSRSPTRRHASPIDNFSSDDNTTSSLYEDSSAKGEHPMKESASYSTAVTKSENRAVTLSKLLVFLVLLIAVSAASSITYVRLNEEERSSFEEMVRHRTRLTSTYNSSNLRLRPFATQIRLKMSDQS